MKKEITEEFLCKLREYAKGELSDKRYAHTLAVEDEISVLADIYCPEKKSQLRAAAILHDITKECKTEKQLKLCQKYGILVTDIMLASPKCFHAKTAAAVASELFGDMLDGEMISAIDSHTTGKQDMGIAEKLLYLADYIEATRSFDTCVKLREYFYRNISDNDDKSMVLDKTLLMSFDFTIQDLINEGSLIMPETVAARNYICARLLQQ